MLKQRITNRVAERFDKAASEVRDGLPPILGVASLLSFTRGQSTKKEALAKWAWAEYQYAKRQVTWFKKKNIFSGLTCQTRVIVKWWQPVSLRGILTNVMASKVEISYRTILFAFALVAGLWLVLQIRDILFPSFYCVSPHDGSSSACLFFGEVPVAAFYCDWPCILGHIRIPGSIVCRRHTGFGGAVHQIYGRNSPWSSAAYCRIGISMWVHSRHRLLPSVKMW